MDYRSPINSTQHDTAGSMHCIALFASPADDGPSCSRQRNCPAKSVALPIVPSTPSLCLPLSFHRQCCTAHCAVHNAATTGDDIARQTRPRSQHRSCCCCCWFHRLTFLLHRLQAHKLSLRLPPLLPISSLIGPQSTTAILRSIPLATLVLAVSLVALQLLSSSSSPLSPLSAVMSAPRVAVITGATGAIGAEIARKVAAHSPHIHVVLPVRNQQKLAPLIEQLKQQTGNPHIEAEAVELSSTTSIQQLCDRLNQKHSGGIHILINNAAVTPVKREENAAGTEMQLAVNVQAYQQLMKGLLPALTAAGTTEQPARIVNVASSYAGGLDLNDLQYRRRRYTANSAYQQSKQANRLQSYVAARLYKPHNVTVNAVYPGFTASQLTNDMGIGSGSDTAEFSARTPAWAAVSEAAAGLTGQYFVRERVAKCEWQRDVQLQQKLWDAVEQLP